MENMYISTCKPIVGLVISIHLKYPCTTREYYKVEVMKIILIPPSSKKHENTAQRELRTKKKDVHTYMQEKERERKRERGEKDS